MSGGLLPPYGEPAGELVDDARVLEVFLRDYSATVYSATFHIEGTVLVADRDVALAIRVAPRTFLVRLDLPGGIEPARQAVQQAMGAEGMSCLDDDSLLAAPVAIQLLGLRSSTWDLWGADLDESFAELRMAAAGEWDVFPEGPPPLGGPPS